MTHVGWDGTGYQTVLAGSADLLNWKKEGLLLGRSPKGSVTRYNAALTCILRDNELFGPSTLKRVNDRFVETYHACPEPDYESGLAVIGLCVWTTCGSRRFALRFLSPTLRANGRPASYTSPGCSRRTERTTFSTTQRTVGVAEILSLLRRFLQVMREIPDDRS